MARSQQRIKRSQTRNTQRSDALVGFIIPLFFVALASYQQVTTHHIDKYVLVALMVFGLGALGWRVDLLFERYLEMKSRAETARQDEE